MIIHRKFKMRTALYIKSCDTMTLLGLEGRDAKVCLESAGWRYAMYRDSSGERFRGYRFEISTS